MCLNKMVAPILVAIAVLGGGYYNSRVAPRVAARMSSHAVGTAASAASSAYPASQAYRQFEYGFQSQMTEREALLLLGFAEGERPDAQAVKVKYHELMKVMHSDADGSSLLAAKINEAREVLSPSKR